MKRYYIDGVIIKTSEKKKQDELNDKAMKEFETTGNFAALLNIKFISELK